MGGAAGHVSQIWEATDMTFGQLKDLTRKVFDGQIDATEKLDGQNVMISYKDGKVIAARSAKELRNYGEEAMDVEAMAEYFSKRGNPPSVEFSYVEAMNDFQKVFEQFDPKILANGKIWLNVEILYEENENVIPYFRNELRIHHLRIIDEKGKTIDIFRNELLDDIEIAQLNLDTTYTIHRTNQVSVVFGEDETIESYIDQLDYMSGNDDSKIISDYTYGQALKMVNSNFGDANPEFNELLAKRWGRQEKHPPINVLLKDRPYLTQYVVREEDKNAKALYDRFLYPLKNLFSEFGIDVLNHLDGLATESPERSVVRLMEKMDDAVHHAEINKTNKIGEHLEEYRELGAARSLVPTEGIVFEYDNRLLKLTGSFTPVLRILGFHRFG